MRSRVAGKSTLEGARRYAVDRGKVTGKSTLEREVRRYAVDGERSQERARWKEDLAGALSTKERSQERVPWIGRLDDMGRPSSQRESWLKRSTLSANEPVSKGSDVRKEYTGERSSHGRGRNSPGDVNPGAQGEQYTPN